MRRAHARSRTVQRLPTAYCWDDGGGEAGERNRGGGGKGEKEEGERECVESLEEILDQKEVRGERELSE